MFIHCKKNGRKVRLKGYIQFFLYKDKEAANVNLQNRKKSILFILFLANSSNAARA